jgi:hypothetical protein
VKIIPEVLITGGGDNANSGVSGLLGMKMLDIIKEKETGKQLLTETAKKTIN